MRTGIDVSSNNHPNAAPIDYAAVHAAGYSWAAVKIDQGDWYVNPFRAEDLSGFSGVGCEVVPYHFADPNTPVDKAAAHFLGSIPSQFASARRCLDFEVGAPNWITCANYINAFIAATNTTLLYLNQSYYAGISPHLTMAVDIWIAAPSLNDFPTYAAVWQNDTTTVPGIQSPTDINQIKDPIVMLDPADITAIGNEVSNRLIQYFGDQGQILTERANQAPKLDELLARPNNTVGSTVTGSFTGQIA